MEVRLNRDGSFRIGDRQGLVSIVQVEPGLCSVLLDGRSYEVFASGDQLFVNGGQVSISVIDPRAFKRDSGGVAAQGRQTLSAAMPGKIVRVFVVDGDVVEAGQGIVVIEAMKMQNEVKSKRAGRVISVSVREGATVSAGSIIAVIE